MHIIHALGMHMQISWQNSWHLYVIIHFSKNESWSICSAENTLVYFNMNVLLFNCIMKKFFLSIPKSSSLYLAFTLECNLAEITMEQCIRNESLPVYWHKDRPLYNNVIFDVNIQKENWLCFFQFIVNEVKFPQSLVDEHSTSHHVQAFNGHPCYRRPCENMGSCVPILGNYTCHCVSGFTGDTCQTGMSMIMLLFAGFMIIFIYSKHIHHI